MNQIFYNIVSTIALVHTGFVQQAHIVFLSRNYEIICLLHVNAFLNFFMKKWCLDIHFSISKSFLSHLWSQHLEYDYSFLLRIWPYTLHLQFLMSLPSFWTPLTASSLFLSLASFTNSQVLFVFNDSISSYIVINLS